MLITISSGFLLRVVNQNSLANQKKKTQTSLANQSKLEPNTSARKLKVCERVGGHKGFRFTSSELR